MSYIVDVENGNSSTISCPESDKKFFADERDCAKESCEEYVSSVEFNEKLDSSVSSEESFESYLSSKSSNSHPLPFSFEDDANYCVTTANDEKSFSNDDETFVSDSGDMILSSSSDDSW